MPLNLPNLDDRRYDDLVREALERIPSLAPEWTNHNAADPGITLVELLAWVTEILIYRTNRIGDRQLAVFVSLLTGHPAGSDRPLADQAREAVLEIRHGTGTVTAGDYERLALASVPGQLARAHCLPGRNLSIRVEDRVRPGHVSISVVPFREGNERHPRPAPELLSAVRRALEDHRLITTRLHVVGPQYVPVRIAASLVLTQNAEERDTVRNVRAALERFLDPVGVAPAKGWPFGRDVYVSELYDLIERQPGIDYVADLDLSADDQWRLKRNSSHKVIAVDLRDSELPLAEIGDLSASRARATLKDRGAIDSE